MRTIRIATTKGPKASTGLAAAAHAFGLDPASGEVAHVSPDPFAERAPGLATLARLLLEDRADVALWDAAAIPLDLPPRLSIGALIRHEDPAYRWVARAGAELADRRRLPSGTRIIATDPLSRIQLAFRYPQLNVLLGESESDALRTIARGSAFAACVSAGALAPDRIPGCAATALPAGEPIPPIGQGTIAVLVADPRPEIEERVRAIHDAGLGACFGVERTFLRAVSGVANSLATARAVLDRGRIDLTGVLAGDDGGWLVVDAARAPERYARAAAEDLADACRETAKYERAGIVSLGELVGMAAGAA